MDHMILTATLGKDPELKQSRDGNTTFAKFSAAWTPRYKDASGDYVNSPTTWLQVTVFGRLAQNVVQSLHKGDRVLMSGVMRAEEWASDQGPSQVVTFRADNVAPDLTFATAVVTKNEKGQQGQSGQSAWGGGGGQQAPAQSRGGFSSQADEEPPF